MNSVPYLWLVGDDEMLPNRNVNDDNHRHVIGRTFCNGWKRKRMRCRGTIYLLCDMSDKFYLNNHSRISSERPFYLLHCTLKRQMVVFCWRGKLSLQGARHTHSFHHVNQCRILFLWCIRVPVKNILRPTCSVRWHRIFAFPQRHVGTDPFSSIVLNVHAKHMILKPKNDTMSTWTQLTHYVCV